ncbi:hypothetical protein ACFLTS_04590 [Chloroflexota bacterium]
MKRPSNFIIAAAIFAVLSGLIYLIHYIIFRDVHHIFIYMVGDFAFLPLEVFLVVIVIERILTRREKRAILQKMNIVVGAFFSEVGTKLLGDLLACFDTSDKILKRLDLDQGWTSRDFKYAIAFAHDIRGGADCHRIDLEELKGFLTEKRQFLLRLLENPILLEHDRFTDLLWALFHLSEEFEARTSLKDLPETDIEHINGDIERMYGRLLAQWLAYIEHLKANYPFLFSLILRTHPFQHTPSAVVK